MIIP
jgi:hypothetical protein